MMNALLCPSMGTMQHWNGNGELRMDIAMTKGWMHYIMHAHLIPLEECNNAYAHLIPLEECNNACSLDTSGRMQ